jgi:hypothetical protein
LDFAEEFDVNDLHDSSVAPPRYWRALDDGRIHGELCLG